MLVQLWIMLPPALFPDLIEPEVQQGSRPIGGHGVMAVRKHVHTGKKKQWAAGSAAHGARISGRRAADRQPFDQQGRLPDARWNALSTLTAHADAFIQSPVTADPDHLG